MGNQIASTSTYEYNSQRLIYQEQHQLYFEDQTKPCFTSFAQFLKMVILRNQRGGSEKITVKKDRADAYSSMRSRTQQRRGSRPNDAANFGERYYRRRRSSSLDASFKFFNSPQSPFGAGQKEKEQQDLKQSKNKFLRYLANSKRKILSRTLSSSAAENSIEEEEQPWSYYKHSPSQIRKGPSVDMNRTTTFVLTQRFIGWKV